MSMESIKDIEFTLYPDESYEKVAEQSRYDIFLVPESNLVIRDKAFPLNYCIRNKETGRVEGYLTTLSSALDTVAMLNQNLDHHEALEEARSMQFAAIGEGDEVH